MKISILLIVLLTFFYSNAQKSNEIIIGTKESIDSKILNEKREIWVHLPKNYVKGQGQKYPVVYLMDGDGHFPSVVGMMQQIETYYLPEMIVVGILNTDRMHDLTPTHFNPNFMPSDSLSYGTTGGGEKFTEFLEKELIPYIDSNYPTAPYKMLIGHSLGGLMVINTLVHHTKLFNAYISIDASLWWDKQKLLFEAEKQLKEYDLKGISLYLGIANTMEGDMDEVRVLADTAESTLHIRSNFQLQKYLEDNHQQMHFDSKYYPNETHGSVPMITEYDAFRFIFKEFHFEMNEKDFLNPDTLEVLKVVNHYKQLSDFFGYEVKIPEVYLNMRGYECMELKQFEKAGHYFKLNIENYPKSWNVYDSYGDYLLAIGKETEAMEYFEKALSIFKFPQTKSKYEALKKKQRSKS